MTSLWNRVGNEVYNFKLLISDLLTITPEPCRLSTATKSTLAVTQNAKLGPAHT